MVRRATHAPFRRTLSREDYAADAAADLFYPWENGK
jgi:hypothetical protein